MKTALLELRNLAGGYAPVSVFRNVNLTINAGESVGFFGPNGHGKTCLLKTVAGLMDPWDGDVIVSGKRLSVAGKRPVHSSNHFNHAFFSRRRIWTRDVVKAGVIYVMQSNFLFPEMSVQEVIEIAVSSSQGRAGGNEMRSLIDTLFPRLRERWNSKIRFLSGGERQMVAIAVGLLALPKLLILDEPTLGLSPKLRMELAEAVAHIKDQGIPLLVVDQNIQFLSHLIDKLYLFDHGTITKEFPCEKMPTQEEIMSMMFEGAAL